jgi:hypothetical protein
LDHSPVERMRLHRRRHYWIEVQSTDKTTKMSV